MSDDQDSQSGPYLRRFNPPSDNTEEFEAVLARRTDVANVCHARTTVEEVPIYSAPDLRQRRIAEDDWAEVLDEWAGVLKTGAGVFVVEQAYEDHAVLDETTEIFQQIISEENQQNLGGDHFAEPGTNDRIWNALEKLGREDPHVFARYYANDIVALASEAWLGPNYQVTSQVNVVRPGASAQQAHRDYHLGFQTVEDAIGYPRHVHELSMALTLQGGIAHCDVPLESGPTRLLPFSQRFEAGYLTYRLGSYQQLFAERHVALPLSKGDALFFNPALYHAAGSNQTADCNRMLNLLQVSSAFGRAMETVDRVELCNVLYPALLALTETNQLSPIDAKRAVRCAADGYPFPTNLDTNPPVDGLAPTTLANLMIDALDNRLDFHQFHSQMVERQQTG